MQFDFNTLYCYIFNYLHEDRVDSFEFLGRYLFVLIQ